MWAGKREVTRHGGLWWSCHHTPLGTLRAMPRPPTCMIMPVMLLSCVPTNTSARSPISSSTKPSSVLELRQGTRKPGLERLAKGYAVRAQQGPMAPCPSLRANSGCVHGVLEAAGR